MTEQDFQQVVDGLRALKTSELIIFLDLDELVDMFKDLPAMTAEDRSRIIAAICAEIDRRIPVPQ